MDVFGILTMIGGLAMFLYGMNTMGDGLEKLSGGRLEQILEKLTQKRFMAVLLGMLVTGVIQSSSATTVMVVGFVNSGIMKLNQAVGIIMGANVGTTVTSWLLSLTGIEGDNMFLKLLKPSSFAPVLALIGIIFLMTDKNGKKKDIGGILLGFTVLMFGMETMSDAVAPLAENTAFTSLLTKFSNPVLGVIAGMVLTAVVQSSSASVGILQALCTTGAITFGAAVPIIMGQNIGTCVTALISSIGTSKNAKRASMIHLYFNLIGTLLFLAVFYLANALTGGFAFLTAGATPGGIALVHTIFNVGAVLVLYPFADRLVALAEATIKDDDAASAEDSLVPKPLEQLDQRFLDHPDYALNLSERAACHMALLTQQALQPAMNLIMDYDADTAAHITFLEEQVDMYDDRLNDYLARLNGSHLSEANRQNLATLQHCITNFERISDHAVNITEIAAKIHKKDLSFSPKALKEIAVYEHAIYDMLDMTVNAFESSDLALAEKIEPLEQVINEINRKAKKHHLKRLRKGKCNIELSVYIEDLYTNLERIADHCSNIGICLLQMQDDHIEAHEYTDSLNTAENTQYQILYDAYAKQYALP